MAIVTSSDSSHRALLPSPASAPRGRVLAIDVVRGLLMCLISVGHGNILLSDSEPNQWFALLISKVTNLGTPAFTCISGMLLGYFEYTHSDFRRIQRKYFIRGVQLITLAHLLITIGTYPLRQETSFVEAYLNYWYITDTLAILFMVLPTLVPRLYLPARLSIGIGCLLAWRVVSLFPAPASSVVLVLKELLFGVDAAGRHLLMDTYPLIPLAGLFMIGTVLGNSFGRCWVEGKLEGFVIRLQKKIVPFILLSGSLLGLWIWGKLHAERIWGEDLRILFYPEKLFSLLPFYLAILFALLAYFIIKIEVNGAFGRQEKFLALFGQNSLFAYVVQYFIIQTIPSLLGWRNQMNAVEMTFYLGGSMMLLFYLVRGYNDTFSKKWNPKKTKSVPHPINREKERIAPFDLPELLDLKKDLW